MSNVKPLTHLGSGHTKYPTQYDPTMLEAISFDAQGGTGETEVEIVCPEFTSLCPKTKQPDFASITIRYIPRDRLVESKSLKLYLFSFRNHGAFHEQCIKMIGEELYALLDPYSLKVRGEFKPRGGISINPEWSATSIDYNVESDVPE